jgi:ribonucleoside-diphosphate reductase beta chain
MGRRNKMTGVAEQFPGAQNPLPWMSEIMGVHKEKNFFKTRVIGYQTGGALNRGDGSTAAASDCRH